MKLERIEDFYTHRYLYTMSMESGIIINIQYLEAKLKMIYLVKLGQLLKAHPIQSLDTAKVYRNEHSLMLSFYYSPTASIRSLLGDTLTIFYGFWAFSAYEESLKLPLL